MKQYYTTYSNGWRNDISARLVFDGLPYFISESRINAEVYPDFSIQLRNSFLLDVNPGNHTLSVQWIKRGSSIDTWKSNPSFLDGYASSRFIIAVGRVRNAKYKTLVCWDRWYGCHWGHNIYVHVERATNKINKCHTKYNPCGISPSVFFGLKKGKNCYSFV